MLIVITLLGGIAIGCILFALFKIIVFYLKKLFKKIDDGHCK